MRILHYGLGFPPYRTGGLTKFTIDLMKRQLANGHEVGLIWPGEFKCLKSSTCIRECGRVDGILSFEIINPNPVSYDEGIAVTVPFMHAGDVEAYTNFLKEYNPDVIHIQTLMGIQKNFVVAAKNLGIRLVFSAHDFFPICPKVTLFRNGCICDCIENCEMCSSCNASALSIQTIKLLQSSFYRKIKDNSLVRIFRKHHRDDFLSDENIIELKEDVKLAQDYLTLRSYYKNILNMVDCIHYNSELTKNIYEKYLGVYPNEVVSITHANISDNRKLRRINGKIRFVYLGPQGNAKGYYELKNALDRLWEVRQDFCLEIYFVPNDLLPYMICHDRYSYDELDIVYGNADVVVVPSKLYETFSYTVAEAISYGVPVVVSSNVGAIDVIPSAGGIVYDADCDDGLFEALKVLDISSIERMSKVLYNSAPPLSIEEMADKIEKLYGNC